ncbi:MAG: putative Diguanylate cyclase/phosphodiesterase [Frankiales bacterium]|nr:putative Diguanylate cyclase/phosphodiesterase [Frankiales bacterium]
MSGDLTHRWRLSPLRRVLPFLLLLEAGCLLVAQQAPHAGLVETRVELVPLLFVFTLLVEYLDIEVVYRNRVYDYTINELPTVMSLCLVGLQYALLVRLLADIAFHPRTGRSPIKLVGNLALHAWELTTAYTGIRLLLDGADVRRPTSWPAVVLALLVASALSILVLTVMKTLYDGRRISLSEPLRDGAQTVAPLIVEGLAACVLLALLGSPAGLVLFLVLVFGVLAWFRQANRQGIRHQQLTLLAGFTDALAAQVETSDVLTTVLGRSSDICRTSRAVLVLDPGDGRLTLVSSRLGEQLTHEVLDRTSLMELVEHGPRLLTRGTASASLTETDLSHGVFVPLRRDGRVVGVLGVGDRTDGRTEFDPSEVRLVESMAAAASVALEKSRLLDLARQESEEREQAALHDQLTGLPNRALMTRHLEQDLVGDATTVVVLGLDRFHDVNDALGQDVGDALLRLVGERLSEACSEGGIVGRLGGDEFLVLLPGALEVCMNDALALQQALEAPFETGGVLVDLRATAGVGASEHGYDAELLIRHAERALREAKDRGVGLLVHDAVLAGASARRLALAPDLRRAVEQAELDVAYQPKVDLRTGTSNGVEALARWTSDRHGFVGPDEFVPLAEQLGLVSALTRFVLDRALALSARTGTSVAVNVSPRGFADGALVEDVSDALTRHAVPAGLLTLEITEGTVMSDPAVGLELLQQLSALGVRLSVDDFGTGYSSLSYLKRLPVDEVKIDRSFVMSMTSDHDDAAIVGSIVRLAHDLGLSVVAEGVETADAWLALRELGCDVAQGYFQSRPVPAEALAVFERAWPAQVEALLAMPPARPLRSIHGT